jgi:hypothetical protein
MARRRKVLQTNFSAGELAPELAMRQETDQYRNGAKSLLNMRCLIGGGVTRRPGTGLVDDLTARSIAVEFTVNQSTRYVLCFAAGKVAIYTSDGVLAQTITGAPWGTAIWEDMDFEQSGDTMFVTHKEMPIQLLGRASTGTFSRAALSFYVGAGGRTEQPYYKIAPASWTLAPSALTGAITLQIAGGNLFVTQHVGQIIRYLSREILITAITDGDTATGTVIEPLPPTQTLTVTASTNFAIGEAVLGDDSGARGQVTGIPDGTHLTVVIIRGLTQFVAEDLIGPNAVTAISAVAAATPAAVTDWDEQLIGPAYGYPAVVALHRNRLLLSGHPSLPDALLASKLGVLNSFDLGTGGDADAIFETIGDAGASEIVQLHSAEQLLIATDHGLYYCPESQASPFRASSIAFFPFGSPWPITRTAKARAFDGGVMFLSGSLVIMARPTGNLTQSWDAEEVSLLSSHIIDSPTRFGVTTNFNGGPERYALLVNADGSLAVMQLVQAQKIRNVTPWTTNGTVQSVACLGGDVYLTTTRTISGELYGGTQTFFFEKLDQALTLDCAREAAFLDDIATAFPDTIVNVVKGNLSLGTYPDDVGDIENPPSGPYTAGFFYATRTEILPPAIEDDEGPIAGEMSRILESYVHVISSARFAQNGYELAAYQVTDDPTIAPPLRSGPQRFQFLGWSRDPTLYITQPDPLPLTILSVKSTVVFK